MIYDIQRFRDLRKSDDDFGYSRYDEDKPAPPSKLFGDVLRDGPPVGIHTIVWCDSVNNLNRTLDRQGLKEFENRILFQMSSNDSSTLIDNPAASKLGENRALYFSEEENRVEKFRPYGLSGAVVVRGRAGDSFAARPRPRAGTVRPTATATGAGHARRVATAAAAPSDRRTGRPARRGPLSQDRLGTASDPRTPAELPHGCPRGLSSPRSCSGVTRTPRTLISSVPDVVLGDHPSQSLEIERTDIPHLEGRQKRASRPVGRRSGNRPHARPERAGAPAQIHRAVRPEAARGRDHRSSLTEARRRHALGSRRIAVGPGDVLGKTGRSTEA